MIKKLACLVLFGCNTPAPIERASVSRFTIESDEVLKPAAISFLRDCNRFISSVYCEPSAKLTLRVSDLEQGTLGLCWYSPSERLIEIDADVVSSRAFWLVLYHEMFHCVLNREHYDTEPDIMNSYEMPELTLKIYANWDEYLGKVFLRGK